MYSGGCRDGAEGAGGGSLKSADRRPANWKFAGARGSPTSMPGMVVCDPEPTRQRQKLPLASTYVTDSRSKLSHGLGWVRKTNE